ncbi:hypothetical protein MPSEU_000789700 [Mayamaea pseudoterrestris]|nr:hypothetical protein MPSEU_000789700 [Mayamaea pseudoterrestris]
MAALAAAPSSISHFALAQKETNQNVFFRFVDGTTLCLWLDPLLDIFTIKQKLLKHQRATGVAAPLSATFASQDLVFVCNGKPLNEHFLLADYQLPPNVTIHVSYRNKGGCFLVSLSVLTIIFWSIIGSPCTCGLSLLLVPLLLPLLFILPCFFL